MLLLSVLCVVLSLELGVATPSGNRFKDTRLKNVGNNAKQNNGEPINPYNIANNENQLIYQENQKKIFKNNQKYENINRNNNLAAFRNVNEQPDVTSESKEYNQNNEERNFNNLNDEPSRTSYIASLPQVNRIQNFRQKDGDHNEANMPRKVDILSEVNDPKNDIAPTQLNPPIIQEKNPEHQIKNKYSRQDSQTPEIFNDMKEDDTTQFDVPEATPEYTKSLFNEYKHTKKNNVKPTNLPRNDISNKKYQSNSQNVNQATFQNPSAEILYETGQAKPYEISNEPLVNSRQGHSNPQNILSDKQRLKNLYLSSKPTKHYMVVYPDGRVEQVDQLDKIQKVHPNYVMLNAKDLLQHGSAVKQNLPTTTTTTIKPQLNSIKSDKIDKVSQAVNDQILPAPIEPFPDATEPPNISRTEVIETNNVAKSSKNEVVTKIITEKYVQNQLQDSETNDSEEKNNTNNNEVLNSGAVVTDSDISDVEGSTISTTENSDIEEIVTKRSGNNQPVDNSTHVVSFPRDNFQSDSTGVACSTIGPARSTMSTPTADTENLNQNIANSVSTSNNTDIPNLSKEPEISNSTASSTLINKKDDSVVTGENTTPTPKQEPNQEDEIAKNTTTTTSDQNSIKENSSSPDSVETSNVLNDTNTSNSSLVSSVNKEERNSTTNFNNGTVITSEDGTDSDGNKFHTETIVTNYDSESKNVTSSDDSTLVSNTNNTDITSSSIVNSEKNTDSLNVTSSNSLTNKTVDRPEKDENNTDKITIQNVSNVTNSEVDGTENSNYTDTSSNNSPGEAYDVSSTQEESNLNKTLSANTVKDGSKNTDDGTDNLPAGNPDVFNEEVGDKATDTSDGGVVSSNDEDSNAPSTASNDQNGVDEDDEDDDTENETRLEASNTNDNLNTEPPSSDGNIVNESSFWFNASESFWKKLMNGGEHNSFYFLFPRPQPNTKETKKITYPNGTIVIVTTETVDNGDGETTSSKTVLTCGNCTTCEKSS